LDRHFRGLRAELESDATDFVKLIVASPKAKQILPQLLTPDISARESDYQHNFSGFSDPCGSAEPDIPVTDGPNISTTPKCANLNAMFMLRGANLAPDAEVRIYCVYRMANP